MTVRAISSTLRAISLGVRCRSEPSTSAIIRSTKECPGSEVIRTTIRSESTTVPPVTARPVATGLADHRGGLAGDRRLVHAGDALDDVAVTGDPLAGHDDDHVAGPQLGARHLVGGQLGQVAGGGQLVAAAAHPAGHGLLLEGAQARRLGLAPALGHGLGEGGEEDGQPQPDGDEDRHDARVERPPSPWWPRRRSRRPASPASRGARAGRACGGRRAGPRRAARSAAAGPARACGGGPRDLPGARVLVLCALMRGTPRSGRGRARARRSGRPRSARRR